MMLKDRAIELGRHNYPVFLLQPEPVNDFETPTVSIY